MFGIKQRFRYGWCLPKIHTWLTNEFACKSVSCHGNLVTVKNISHLNRQAIEFSCLTGNTYLVLTGACSFWMGNMKWPCRKWKSVPLARKEQHGKQYLMGRYGLF